VKTLKTWTTEEEAVVFSLQKNHGGDLEVVAEDIDDGTVVLATEVQELEEVIQILTAVKQAMIRAETAARSALEEDEEDDGEDIDLSEEEDEEEEDVA
jgi:hypothetical protein